MMSSVPCSHPSLVAGLWWGCPGATRALGALVWQEGTLSVTLAHPGAKATSSTVPVPGTAPSLTLPLSSVLSFGTFPAWPRRGQALPVPWDGF